MALNVHPANSLEARITHRRLNSFRVEIVPSLRHGKEKFDKTWRIDTLQLPQANIFTGGDDDGDSLAVPGDHLRVATCCFQEVFECLLASRTVQLRDIKYSSPLPHIWAFFGKL